MPKVTRRDFIKIGGAAAAGMAVGSKKTAKAMEVGKGESSFNYARTAKKREPYYTVSPFGKLKSPLEVYLEDEETVVGVAGHPGHPATRGRTSALDAVSHLSLSDPDRITFPMKQDNGRGSMRWRKISWEKALKEISDRIRLAIDEKGADSVCLVRGEDTQDGLIKRFMHTLGSASTVEISGDRNKRTGQSITWGVDMETPDFANSDYILNFGANIYETFPPFAQAVIDGRMDNHAKLVTLDPRMSMTAGLSDEWVPVMPGTDGLVALAMANVIMQEGLADEGFIDEWTNIESGKLAKHLSKFTTEMAEEHSGIPADTIGRIAVEFAKAKSATLFTYRGVSSHSNGVYSERACMLLPIITGNVEVKGGYCLPRKMEWAEAGPVPPAPDGEAKDGWQTFPFDVKSGNAKVGVLINCGGNPAHSAPASAYWRDVLKNEELVPFSVGISTHITDTMSLCDIVLPNTVYLENSEPVSSPSTLFPWLGAVVPVSEAPEEVRPLSMILHDIIHSLDEEGGLGYKKYWDFDSHEDLMTKYFEKVPELGEEGGYETLTESAIWPAYGELDTNTGKFLDDDGEPLEAEYGIHEKDGFNTPSKKIEIYSALLESRGLDPLPTWIEPDNLKSEKEGKEGLVFVTYKTAYMAGAATANNKYLAEKDHSNHCMINKETAREKKIKDGDMVRVVSPAGYIVTRARTTNAIHPKVVAMSASFGNRIAGRVAAADPEFEPNWAEGEDKDVGHNLWWRDNGVSPNDICPLFVDPAGKGASLAFIVDVELAKEKDRYGDVKADLEAHESFFYEAAG